MFFHFAYAILLLVNFCKADPCKDLLLSSTNDTELLSKLHSNINSLYNYSSSCIDLFLQNSCYLSLDYYLTSLSKQNVHFRETLSTSINTITKNLEAINNKYRFSEKDYQIVSPAFQWAQSLSFVFIEVKFAHRHDSPGCLEINNLKVDINGNHLYLLGYCVLGDIPIKFELNLETYSSFDKEGNEMKFGSVGRYQMQLKKKESNYWERLLADKERIISNMKIWFEMRNRYESEIAMYESRSEDDEEKTFEEIEREIKEKRKKRRKKKKKTVKSDL